MSTHDYNLANQSGASFRSDLNNCLAAILSNNSNGSAPSTTVAYSIWADSTAGKLKIRNAANDGFVDLINLDGTIQRDISLTGDLTLTDKIIHSGDTNTAIRFPAADTFTIETAGSERLRVDSSGNVGIGATPSVTLDIESTTPTIRLTDSDATGTPESEIRGGGGDLVFSADRDNEKSSTVIGFNIDGSEKMRVDTSGRLGLGTSSPTHLLHLESASTPALKIIDTTNSVTLLAYAQDADIHIGTYSNHPLIFDTNSSERFRVAADGKVGIGTSSPLSNSILHVKSSDASDYRPLVVEGSATNGSGIAIHNSGAQRIYIGSGGDNTLSGSATADGVIRTETNTVLAVGNSERMRIDSSGHFLFNCTSLPSSSNAGVAFEKNGGTGVLFHSNGSATTAINVGEFINGNGVVGRITTSGSNCSFTDVSDYRLKENEVLISDGITRLKQLKPYRFNYKTDASKTFDGFFAHEAQAVVPESVVGEKDATKKDGSIDPQCIDQSKLVPLLVAAVQELIGKVAALEAA